jgi:hypothetical protein
MRDDTSDLRQLAADRQRATDQKRQRARYYAGVILGRDPNPIVISNTSFGFSADAAVASPTASATPSPISAPVAPNLTEIAAAIKAHDLNRLKVLLGPAAYLVQQRYNQKRHERQQQWGSLLPEMRIYSRALGIVQWYARKIAYDRLWSRYAATHSHDVNFSERQQQFEALTRIYTERGIAAYSEALTNQFSTLYTFFTAEPNGLFANLVATDPTAAIALNKLSAQQQAELGRLLQAELAEKVSPSAVSSYQAPAVPSSKPVGSRRRLQSHQERSDGAEEVKHAQTDGDSKGQQALVTQSSDDIAIAIQPEDESSVTVENLRAVANSIVTEIAACDNMEDVLAVVYEGLRLRDQQRAQLHKTQADAFTAYQVEQLNVLRDYRIMGRAVLGNSPQVDTDLQKIINSGIGQRSLDEIRVSVNIDSETQNIPLLHYAMHVYQSSNNLQTKRECSAIIEYLLQRDCSPAIEYNGQNAFQFADIEHIPLAWLNILSKVTIATTPEAHQALLLAQTEIGRLTSPYYLGTMYLLLNQVWYWNRNILDTVTQRLSESLLRLRLVQRVLTVPAAHPPLLLTSRESLFSNAATTSTAALEMGPLTPSGRREASDAAVQIPLLSGGAQGGPSSTQYGYGSTARS